jgi:hypothetical protein
MVEVPDDRWSNRRGVDLVPTGVPRAGINFGIPTLAQRDAVTGETHGMAADLAKSAVSSALWSSLLPSMQPGSRSTRPQVKRLGRRLHCHRSRAQHRDSFYGALPDDRSPSFVGFADLARIDTSLGRAAEMGVFHGGRHTREMLEVCRDQAVPGLRSRDCTAHIDYPDR